MGNRYDEINYDLLLFTTKYYVMSNREDENLAESDIALTGVFAGDIFAWKSFLNEPKKLTSFGSC